MFTTTSLILFITSLRTIDSMRIPTLKRTYFWILILCFISLLLFMQMICFESLVRSVGNTVEKLPSLKRTIANDSAKNGRLNKDEQFLKISSGPQLGNSKKQHMFYSRTEEEVAFNRLFIHKRMPTFDGLLQLDQSRTQPLNDSIDLSDAPATQPTGSERPCRLRTVHLSARPLPLTGLVSFPGSGNTWVRHLVQQLTGREGNMLSQLLKT